MRVLGRCLMVVFLLPATLGTIPGRAQTPADGGTVRLGIADLWFTAGLDPTGEYDRRSWALFSNLLLRTLVTYKHISGPEGNVLVPDLATEVPAPTDGGLTYTFRLRDGIRFGPPLERTITSRDVKYAFARIKCRSCYAQYGFYYLNTIQGMRPRTSRPRPATISGIETPDDRTIVFHLTRPTGDFLHRLALPATAPIPREIARCFSAYGYGRHLVASGPYMIAGSSNMHAGDGCEGLEPPSGYRLGRHLRLVRNPNHDAATDNPAARENLIDRWILKPIEDERELFAAIAEGELDGALATPPADVKRAYANDPDTAAMLHSNPRDVTYYLTMNLTKPPFNDVHVRRALNFAMDRSALVRSWGGPIEGSIATHILPPEVTGGHPTGEEYEPYPTDLGRARAEMAMSRYDADGDGRCDAAICSEVKLVGRNVLPWTTMEPYVRRAFAAIGIDVRIRRMDAANAYTFIFEPRRGISVAINPGWGKDYPDPSTVIAPLFHSRNIRCDFNVNHSLVGATRAIKHRCDLTGDFSAVPSVDAEIETCEALFPTDERTACWRALDRRLMEEVVPWVPYIWHNSVRVVGPRIAKVDFDQFTGELALGHMSLGP